MSKKLFVGNLSWEITSEELGQFFVQAGEIISAVVIFDRDSGKSKGFGFVEMATKDGFERAVALDGQYLNGRKVVVNVAKPREGDSRPEEVSNGDPRARKHPEETAFMKTIKKFIKIAEVGEEIGFSSNGGHFTITRDDQPDQPPVGDNTTLGPGNTS